MANNILTVDSTKNKYVPENLKQSKKQMRKMMTELGLLPPPYDSAQSIDTVTDGDRFSKYYATSSEFESDKSKALGLINSGKIVPDYLYKKISETVKEVEKQYDGYYNHL